MTPASFFTGAPPGSRGQKKEIEKPRPSPAGPRKSLYAVFSARETSLVHPLKVDSRMRDWHTIVAVRLKLRITILLKKANGPQQSCTHRGAAIRLTTRLNGSCLCAISQLGSYMSCRVGRSRAAMALFCEVVGRVSESVTCHHEHNSMRGYGGLRLPPSLFELRRTSRLTNPPYELDWRNS